MKRGKLLQIHLPQDEPGKSGEQQIFQREQGEVEPEWNGL